MAGIFVSGQCVFTQESHPGMKPYNEETRSFAEVLPDLNVPKSTADVQGIKDAVVKALDPPIWTDKTDVIIFNLTALP